MGPRCGPYPSAWWDGNHAGSFSPPDCACDTGQVAGTLPDGDPAPENGALPESALRGVGRRPFGVYVHVPFCATRCGYCDFNTYTAGELGTSASPGSWLDAVRRELDLAAEVLGTPPKARTVFV